jgi:lipopolysaccharide/colanic/teichoic acid biosynthesis glycosyltransferase
MLLLRKGNFEMESVTESGRMISYLHPAISPSWWRNFLKRAFDILASFIGLIIFAPLAIPIIVLLRREGPGPIFYRGSRMGRGEKSFGILKFRTMRECPESYNGPRITAKDDDRITPLGHWLRDTKLNEFPQLWNVLIGEMSLVGPRPEDPEIAKTWPLEARAEIMSMRPGLTSPASVLYRDEESMLPADGVMDVYFRDILPDKLRLDRLYVRNYSFFGDLDVIFWTAAALLPRIARQRVPEGDLFAGPLYRFVRRYFSWFVLDFLISLVAVTLVASVWRLFEPIDWGVSPLAVLAFAVAVLFSSMNVFLGLDRVVWTRAGAEDALILAASNGMTLLIILLFNYLQEHYAWISVPALPTELIILIGVLTLIGCLFARYQMRLVTSFASRWLSWRKESGGFGERVLILGAGEGGQIVNWLLHRGKLHHAFTVVGMVDDDPAKLGMRIDGCWILGGTGDVSNLVRKHDIGVILFTISNVQEDVRRGLIKLCQISGVRLVFLNDIMITLQGQLSRQEN